MAVKSESVQTWIKVLIPVVYLVLIVQQTYSDGMSGEIKYYYRMHRIFHGLTRWSRRREVNYMELYYESVNQ